MNILRVGKDDIMKGKIPEEMLGPLLDSLPVEITLTDANDKIIAWTHAKPHIFDRPDAILGQDVRKCHPPKSQVRLEQLMSDLKSGKIDSEASIIDRPKPDGTPGKIKIEYIALRDSENKYLGCLEICNYIE